MLGREYPKKLNLFVSLLAAIAVITGCTSESPGTTIPRQDIILITVDTLRQDHVSLYGYGRDTTPRLDRFFSHGAVFTRAYSTVSATPGSVVSFLSGLHPQQHGVRRFYQLVGEDTKLLPEYLSSTHQTAGFVSSGNVRNHAMGMGDRFDHYDDLMGGASGLSGNRSAEATTNAVINWLAEQRDPDRPLFLWIHYIDPHSPYRPPRDWIRHFRSTHSVATDAEKIPPSVAEYGIRNAMYYVDAYDEEIAYTDRQIERFLTGYDQFSSLEDALVIFNADHGETMTERDEQWFSHGYHVYEELIQVPFMIRGPGVEVGRYSDLVSGIDLLPTILAYAGYPMPYELPGVNILDHRNIDPDRIVFAESARKGFLHRTAIQRNLKVIAIAKNVNGELSVGETGVFDLAKNPGEEAHNQQARLSPGQIKKLIYLRQSLIKMMEDDPHPPGGRPVNFIGGQPSRLPDISPRATEEDLEALRALGYVE